MSPNSGIANYLPNDTFRILMKEDILEQLVDDFLQTKGYFTRHNIKFRLQEEDRRKGKDGNHSDIDVIGLHPSLPDPQRVMVVSCKSWQSGFKVSTKLREIEGNKVVSGREAWKGFRELTNPQWSKAFLNEVEKVTGTRKFTYVTAVTRIEGKKGEWENYPLFKSNLEANPVVLVELSEMLQFIKKKTTTTMASSTIGRVLQLMKAAEKGKKELEKAIDEQLPESADV